MTFEKSSDIGDSVIIEDEEEAKQQQPRTERKTTKWNGLRAKLKTIRKERTGALRQDSQVSLISKSIDRGVSGLFNDDV